ncbi:cytochrome c oxidase assembly protein [Pontibacter sp. MBLB2868]|uniref:cytochrome c oxidase assembly protein n=1 Tax=Pontibacter sp. MBLB2868 TaxID=3451555 RepID=UPI003F750B8C
MRQVLLDISFSDIPLCGVNTAAGSVWNNWLLNPGMLVIFVAMAGLYFLLSGGRLQKGAGLYFAALLLLLLVQTSPLHFLAMHYLFSAHMISHIVILLLCAPMLVLGLPKQVAQKPKKIFKAISQIMMRWPWLGWLSGIGVMWFWHIPAVFDAAFPASHTVFNLLPLLHTFSLLVAGVLFAWPILGPLPKYRINPLAGVVYLFTACIACSLLGLLITFAPLGIYHHYLAADPYGFASTIRNGWGITTAVDQQMAGLIMWVPCCFIYLSGSLYLFLTWLSSKEEQPEWENSGYKLKRNKI